jgi:two-component system chemotaxis response regulator CheV
VEQHYAVNVTKVLEILRRPKIIGLPEVQHPSILGTFNYRGKVIPLVDLKAYLNLGWVNNERAFAVVTEFNNAVNAFLVSGVSRIHRLSWEDVEPPGEFLVSVGVDCVTGVITFDRKLVFMIDLEKIVADLNPGSVLASSESDQSGRRYKVLHADDSSVIRGMMKKEMEKGDDFEIAYSAKDGAEALEVLLDLKEQARAEGGSITESIDLAVLDIEMPKRDGLSLCKVIKDDPDMRALPVIIFSSMISEKTEHKARSVGANGQIGKPDIGRIKELAFRLLG